MILIQDLSVLGSCRVCHPQMAIFVIKMDLRALVSIVDADDLGLIQIFQNISRLSY